MVPLKHKPLHQQVEDFIRARIESGEYPVDSKIPTTNELGVITGTSVWTAQTALTSLCREGLLDRRPGRGTYVKSGRAVLTCVGIYFGRPQSLGNTSFTLALEVELRAKLATLGIRARIWSDDRLPHERTEPLESLKRAMEKHEIQGIIAFSVQPQDLRWLTETSMPAAIVTTHPAVSNRVYMDFPRLFRLGLRHLRKQGCKTVGVISTVALHQHTNAEFSQGFYRFLIDEMASAGLTTQNEWCQAPSAPVISHLQYGYEEFLRLWGLAKRPQGLLVFPDTAAAGVVSGILQLGVSVPRDLRVVFHANDQIPYPCPIEATLLMTRVSLFADTLIDSVRSQVQGIPASVHMVPSLLVPNKPPAPFSRQTTI
jgi:hypothetical protein